MERLTEYTPAIKAAIAEIKYRMDCTLIPYDDSTIEVFEDEGTVYVLANPVLGNEEVIDSDGNIKVVPLYNITVQYPQDWIKFEGDKIPRLRILRPDLCKKVKWKN